MRFNSFGIILTISILFASGCSSSSKKTEIAIARNLSATDDSSRWRLTKHDEFEDANIAIAKGADPACFSKTAVCSVAPWGHKLCRSETRQNLRNLNKCTWRVAQYYNYMDHSLPEGEGINAFDPSMVEVKNGYLNLYADTNQGPHGKCKVKVQDPKTGQMIDSTECPFFSGLVDSRPVDEFGMKVDGMTQKFGRFEVRTKHVRAPGAWNAVWMIPDEKQLPDGRWEHNGWPYSGEIDIIDTGYMPKTHTNGGFFGGGGVKDEGEHASTGYIGKGTKQMFPDMNSEQRKHTFHRDFHVYAVEWTPFGIQFIIDDFVVHSIAEGQLVQRIRGDIQNAMKDAPIVSEVIRASFDKKPIHVPTLPFFWILNYGIVPAKSYAEEFQPDYDRFLRSVFMIDYVRIYEKCAPSDQSADCILIPKRDAVDQYNTEDGEDARARIDVYPSPQNPGEPIKVKLDLKQDCDSVKVVLINMLGQEVKLLRTEADGRMEAQEIIYEVNDTMSFASGMYMATAFYEGCGPSGEAKGNQVFKFMMINQ